jgi:hypothetical protein
VVVTINERSVGITPSVGVTGVHPPRGIPRFVACRLFEVKRGHRTKNPQLVLHEGPATWCASDRA